MTHQECINCKTTYDIDEIVYFCKKCGDILEIKFDFKELAETLKESGWMSKAVVGLALPRLYAYPRSHTK